MSLARRQPVEAVRLVPAMAERLGPLLAAGNYDVAHVGLGPLAGLAPVLGDLPAVLAPLDAWDSALASEANGAGLARRAWLAGQGRLVQRYISRAYTSFDRVVLVTDADERDTVRISPGLATTVITNGVDTATFDRTLRLSATRRSWCSPAPCTPPRTPRPPAIWPRTSCPGSVAAGPMSSSPSWGGRRAGRWRNWRGSRACAAPVGDVADLRPWLRRAGVFVCPMVTGTGIKNKLLEALACVS